MVREGSLVQTKTYEAYLFFAFCSQSTIVICLEGFFLEQKFIQNEKEKKGKESLLGEGDCKYSSFKLINQIIDKSC